MGEAKKRGTFEQRKEAAQKRLFENSPSISGYAQHVYKKITILNNGRLIQYISGYQTPTIEQRRIND